MDFSTPIFQLRPREVKRLAQGHQLVMVRERDLVLFPWALLLVRVGYGGPQRMPALQGFRGQQVWLHPRS